MNVITASSARKTSFGCHSGARSTLFGYAFAREVIEDHQDLNSMDWAGVMERVGQTVHNLERELKLGRKNDSEPQYFAN